MQIAEADEEYSNFYLEGKEEEMKKVENIQAAIRRILIGNEGYYELMKQKVHIHNHLH